MSGDWWMRGMKVVSPDWRTRDGGRPTASARKVLMICGVSRTKHARSREGHERPHDQRVEEQSESDGGARRTDDSPRVDRGYHLSYL
jgi:hypothetical protein